MSAALELFPSQPVDGAAEAFQSLLRILGPEAAVECVLRSVSLSQGDNVWGEKQLKQS